MSMKSFIQKKKRAKEAETLDIGQFVLKNSDKIVNDFINELRPKLIKETEQILKAKADDLVKNVRKGDKGDVGDSIKGDKGDSYILTSQDKKEIASKIKVPVVDKIIEKTEVIKEVEKKTDPKDIAKKLNTLKEVIDPKTIKGLEETLKQYATAITSAQNKPILAGGGGFVERNFIDDETPTGTVNGTNKVFTLANTPNPSTSLKVFVNGARMRITEDYTLSGATITFITAPPTTSIILCDYRK